MRMGYVCPLKFSLQNPARLNLSIYIRDLLNYRMMSKWHACFVVATLLMILHLSQANKMSQGSGTIPAYTYKFDLEQNQVMNATLNKENNELQLLLYKQGQNILNDSEAIAKSTNSTGKFVNMLSLSTSYPSSYYLRVIPVALYSQLTDYTVNVLISNFSQGKYTKHKQSNFSGSINRYNPHLQYCCSTTLNISILPILVGTTGTNHITPILYNPRLQKRRLQYEIHIPQNIPIYINPHLDPNIESYATYSYHTIYYKGSKSTYKIATYKYPSQWQLYFQHNFTNLTDIVQFQYYLYLHDGTGFARQFSDALLGLILGNAFGCMFILIIVFTMGDIFLRWCGILPRREQNAREIGGNQNDGKGAAEIREMQIQKWELCTICLQENCNSHLPCGHVFHENCIREWVFLKRECPSCRASYGLNAITTPVKPLKDDP